VKFKPGDEEIYLICFYVWPYWSDSANRQSSLFTWKGLHNRKSFVTRAYTSTVTQPQWGFLPAISHIWQLFANFF